MILLSLFAALVGFTALASAMERHHRDILGTSPSRLAAGFLRGVGALLLLCSYGLAFAAWGPALGSVGWFGLLWMSATAVAFGLAYSPLEKLRNRRRSIVHQPRG